MKWILPPNRKESIIDFLLKQRGLEGLNLSSLDMIKPAFDMYNVEKASDEVFKAVKLGKKIFIHGDFDADGITATAILWSFLYKELNANVTPYIPNRFDEGYGLSDKSIQAMINMGAELIITVDCGIKDIELVYKYSDKVDFIITDHHTIRKQTDESLDKAIYLVKNNFLLPAKAKAVVHPKINHPQEELCGAGVAWKLCYTINQKYINSEYIFKLLGLVAIGTVCDIMPLVGENRLFVKEGIKQLRTGTNIGINELCKVSGIEFTEISSYQIGYIIGPRLNAAGRLGSAIDSVRLLSTESQANAKNLAQKLNDLNIRRQNLTLEYFLEAEKLVEKDKEIIFIKGEKWPEGILGLIAGRLTEKYNRPAIVFSTKENFAKGSARSIEEFNMTEALTKHKNLIEKFGGHNLAAGLTVNVNHLVELENSLYHYSTPLLKEVDKTKKLYIDAVGDLSELNIKLAETITTMGPFGYKNEEPVLASFGTNLLYFKTMGANNNHIRAIFNSGNSQIEAVSFGNADELLNLFKVPNQKYSIAGRLIKDKFNGNVKAKLILKDVVIFD